MDDDTFLGDHVEGSGERCTCMRVVERGTEIYDADGTLYARVTCDIFHGDRIRRGQFTDWRDGEPAMHADPKKDYIPLPLKRFVMISTMSNLPHA